MDAVGKLELRTRHRRAVGLPEGHDIVVGLVVGRDLDSAGRGPCPSRPAARSTPTGGARSGTPRPGSGRNRGRAAAARSRAGFRRETRRPAGCGGLASGRQTHSPLPRHIDEAVGIVDLLAPLVGDAALVLAEPEHAGHGGDAQPLDRLARDTAGPSTSMVGDPAGRDAEAVGAGDALALQERVGGQHGVGRRAGGPARSGVKRGNSSGRGRPVSIARPRQDMPYWLPASVARK